MTRQTETQSCSYTCAGLLITKTIAAYVNLHEDTRNGDVPRGIDELVKTGRFDDAARRNCGQKSHEHTLLAANYYYDTDYACGILRDYGITVCECSLSKHIANLGIEPPEPDDERYWIPSTETSLDAIVADIRSKLDGIVPDKLDLRPYVRDFTYRIDVAPHKEA